MYVEDFEPYLSTYLDGYIKSFFDYIQFQMILKARICNHNQSES